MANLVRAVSVKQEGRAQAHVTLAVHVVRAARPGLKVLQQRKNALQHLLRPLLPVQRQPQRAGAGRRGAGRPLQPRQAAQHRGEELQRGGGLGLVVGVYACGTMDCGRARTVTVLPWDISGGYVCMYNSMQCMLSTIRKDRRLLTDNESS